MGNSSSSKITGTRSPGGQCYPRLEIDAFCQDAVSLNLFLLALAELQGNGSDNLKNKWSWFSISGIHASPAVQYDGVGGRALTDNLQLNGRPYQIREEGGEAGQGYCTHGSVLLVYGVAFEQAIQDKMKAIARNFGGAARNEYLEAADKFRLPFWNPFQARNFEHPDDRPVMGISLIFCVKKVRVKEPGSREWTTIDNPLYSYVYPTDEQLSEASLTGNAYTAFLNGIGTDTCTTRNSPADQPSVSDHLSLQKKLIRDMNPAIPGPGDGDGAWVPGSAFDPGAFVGAGMKAKLYA
ncbi:hypothetical protein GP486_008647, partial [Trichoglossum hirsutum]